MPRLFLAVAALACLERSSANLRGTSPATGTPEKSTEQWEAHAYDHASKITPDQRVLPDATAPMSAAGKGQGCVDDPMWRDADGDGCEIYRFAIESGKSSREAICHGGGEAPVPRALRARGARRAQVVSDATAGLFCRATCGCCQD